MDEGRSKWIPKIWEPFLTKMTVLSAFSPIVAFTHVLQRHKGGLAEFMCSI